MRGLRPNRNEGAKSTHNGLRDDGLVTSVRARISWKPPDLSRQPPPRVAFHQNLRHLLLPGLLCVPVRHVHCWIAPGRPGRPPSTTHWRMISNRLFCGSRTPGPVGTRRWVSPNPRVAMTERGTPSRTHSPATAPARRSDRPGMYGGVPEVSCSCRCPLTAGLCGRIGTISGKDRTPGVVTATHRTFAWHWSMRPRATRPCCESSV